MYYFLFAILLLFLISLPIVTFWLWKKEKSFKIKEVPLFLWRRWNTYFFVFLGIIISSFSNKHLLEAEVIQLKEKKVPITIQTDTISKLWKILVFEKGGCLVGEQYVSKERGKKREKRAVFHEKSWKDFSNHDKEKLTDFLITKLSDTTKTKIHTCPFFGTTTGEMAVYSLQHIHNKNWFDFSEFIEYKNKESKSAIEQPQVWLQNILKNEKSREKLAKLFKK